MYGFDSPLNVIIKPLQQTQALMSEPVIIALCILGTSIGFGFLQEVFAKKKNVKIIAINCDDFFIIALLNKTLELLETMLHGSL